MRTVIQILIGLGILGGSYAVFGAQPMTDEELRDYILDRTIKGKELKIDLDDISPERLGKAYMDILTELCDGPCPYDGEKNLYNQIRRHAPKKGHTVQASENAAFERKNK